MSKAVPEIWSSKGWRKGVAILGVAYCLVAFVLPVAVTVVFRDLPYLQERGFLECLALSAVGSTVLVAAMLFAFPERARIYRGRTPWETAKNGLLAAMGLAMATAVPAAWSGNVLGALARFLPGHEYSARFTVSDVENGSRAVYLELTPKEGTREAYLTMSKRRFEVPAVDEGDELLVNGKQTVAGVYVDGFRLVSRRGQAR